MRHRLIRLASAFAVLAALAPAGTARADATSTYNHIFVIVEENSSFNEIIGDHNAPNINSWAQTYGLATQYFGAIHPSEGNYIALVGGNAYGITDDALWTNHRINQPNLVDQLEQASLSWKGYFENMPFAGYTGKFADGELYAAKHNGFLNFDDINGSQARLNKLVTFGSLAADLAANNVPNFSFIVPNQCNDMHGLAQCPNKQTNISVGDTWAAGTVSAIRQSPAWASGNNAIVVVWDEGVSTQGCCDANDGGGRVPAIVITNHGPRGLSDGTPGNHYSLVTTIQQAFGLGCTASFNGAPTPVGFTCDRANVTPLSHLFAVAD